MKTENQNLLSRQLAVAQRSLVRGDINTLHNDIATFQSMLSQVNENECNSAAEFQAAAKAARDGLM